MKNSIAVSVNNVSKKFRLFGSSKDRFWEALHPFNKKYHREFWALKDINFEVPKGTTLGIVGRNGSGKSILLQIICSVLQPTSGTVNVNGRVSALLELGAGFNPEFTGRENVLLNGALMGFPRAEMEERLPVIEAFADIGEFVDQPVKTYSSGMFVRLAFAAAINVDPDVLIVDEVLAVGDAKFQHKCYQKFIEFQKAGKTIIIVTHSTDAVVRHCDQAVLLENGRVVEIGEPKSITNYYMDLLFTGQISGYINFPTLVEESCQGFNIVHYGMKYYALSQSLGPIDLNRPYENELREYIAEKKCLIGSSLDEVKHLLNRNVSPAIIQLNHNLGISPSKKEKTELKKFLEEIPDTDNCVNRRSYNKNEYRFGDKRAEIIDYLLVCGNKADPVTVESGSKIDIYVKAIFHQDIDAPRFGNAVKMTNGFLICGGNTWISKISLPCYHTNEVIVHKMTIKMDLNAGDWFIDLGVAGSSSDGAGIPADIRCGVIHLHVEQGKAFTGGAVALDMSFSEVCKVLPDKC
jgi:ABC-type polysaccharide/polyol phosphate transport system ATPase subunit